MKLKILSFFCLVLFAFSAQAQNHTIQLYFLYGSKPAKGYKKTEKKLFGGLHGGHVSIGVDSSITGFGPVGKFHIFSKKKRNAGFRCEDQASFNADSVGKKYTTITIPITNEQYEKITGIHNGYLNNAPYDYAFIGMRCAAASYDVLSQLGLVKAKGKTATKLQIFYPRRLRKRMLKMAKEKGYKVHYQAGSKTRVWEKD